MARSSFPELLKTRFSFLNSTAQVPRMFFCKVFWEALWKELYCEGVSCPCCALPMAPPAPAGPCRTTHFMGYNTHLITPS